MRYISAISILILIICVSTCSCAVIFGVGETSVPQTSIPESFLESYYGTSEPVSEHIPDEKAWTAVDCGIPIATKYTSNTDTARNVWDIICYDGYLYVGSGDFDKNAGPCELWRMNLDTGRWEISGEVMDEQINRFEVIGGQLVSPGTDPRASWSSGTWYRLTEEDTWETINNIPGGVHIFDMIEFDGKFFAALGSVAGNSAMVVSNDGGITFESVGMIKDGQDMAGFMYELNRVYDLFVIEDTLCALYYGGKESALIFTYNGSYFEYNTSWKFKLIYNGWWYHPIGDKVNFDGKLYIAAGSLYAVDGTPENIKNVRIEGVNHIWDVLTYDGKLYALCATVIDDGYTVSVMSLEEGSSTFELVLGFDYDIPARSFAFDGEKFYFGMGTLTDTGENLGRILSVEVE